jgi:mono/diheme cytochrome c family protein
LRVDAVRRIRCLMIVLALAAAATRPSLAIASEEQTKEQRELYVTGAKLWPVYCAQCHNARPGSQFSPAQWDAITMHMRTQSIMPAKDIRAITEFLKRTR